MSTRTPCSWRPRGLRHLVLVLLLLLLLLGLQCHRRLPRLVRAAVVPTSVLSVVVGIVCMSKLCPKAPRCSNTYRLQQHTQSMYAAMRTSHVCLAPNEVSVHIPHRVHLTKPPDPEPRLPHIHADGPFTSLIIMSLQHAQGQSRGCRCCTVPRGVTRVRCRSGAGGGWRAAWPRPTWRWVYVCTCDI